MGKDKIMGYSYVFADIHNLDNELSYSTTLTHGPS